MLSYHQGGCGDLCRCLAAAFNDNQSSCPSVVQCVPAGYRSHTLSSVSSLSLGGLTDDTEFDCSSPSRLDNLLQELSTLQTVHPVTGSWDSYRAADQFHMKNIKMNFDKLQTTKVDRQMQGKLISQMEEQLFAQIRKDAYFINSMGPTKFISVLHLLLHWCTVA